MSHNHCRVLMEGKIRECGRPVFPGRASCIFHTDSKTREEEKCFTEELKKELERLCADPTVQSLDFTRFVFPSQNGLFKWTEVTTRFPKPVIFEYASFVGGVEFSKCIFDAEAQFFATAFGGHEVYLETRFPGDFAADRNSVFVAKGVFFRDVEYVSPGKVQFRGLANARIDLRNVSFLSTNIENVVFVDERWQRDPPRWARRTRKRVIDEDLIESSKQYLDHPLKQALPSYEKVKRLYRDLRKNYEAAGRYAEAGDFFIGEMEMRRLDTTVQSPLFRWLSQNCSLLGLYKHVSLYGESHGRLIAWSAVLVILFTVLRLVHSPNALSAATVFSRFGDSAAAFFQFPKSNYTLDLVERIISAFVLGLLLVSLKRNFERK